MKSIKVLQWSWIAEELFLILLGAILCLWGLPEQRAFFLAYLSPVQLIIGAEGAVAFGGPQLSKLQANQSGGAT